MKKILAILLAAILILGLLSACGSKAPAQEAETAAETSEAQTAPEGETKAEDAAKPEGEAKPEETKPEETKSEDKDVPAATEQKIPGGVAFYPETTVVAADAGNGRLVILRRITENPCGFDQRLVSGGMTVCVVDGFEIVQIDHEQMEIAPGIDPSTVIRKR